MTSSLDKINDPFSGLSSEGRPTASPWDLRLAFNTLAPDRHIPFQRLMGEIQQHHMGIYNRPEMDADTRILHDFASAAGLDLIATEIARSWGVEDRDGPRRVPHCTSLRCWPDIESTVPQTMQIWLAHKRPNMILGFLPVGGGERLSVRKDHYTLMHEEGRIFRPGDWIGDLLMEYARLRVWRDLRDKNQKDGVVLDIPRPATTLPHPTLQEP